MRRALRWRLAAALACMLGLTGCDGAPKDPQPETGDPACTLGTGAPIWEPLADGDELPVIFGPQGGYHVWGSVRATGIDPGDFYDAASPDNPTTVFNAYLDDGTRVGGTARLRSGLKVRSDGVMEHVGEPVLLAIVDPAELVGQAGRVTVEIEDVDGVVVMDEKAVVFVPES